LRAVLVLVLLIFAILAPTFNDLEIGIARANANRVISLMHQGLDELAVRRRKGTLF
jgi:hypothetical protein